MGSHSIGLGKAALNLGPGPSSIEYAGLIQQALCQATNVTVQLFGITSS